MTNTTRADLLLALPAAGTAMMAQMLQLPDWLALALVSIAAFVPVALALRRSRLRLQAQRDANMAFIRNLIDVIPQPMYVKDAESRHLIVNRAFTTELDHSFDEVVGKTSVELARRPEDASTSRDEDLAVLAGGTVNIERLDTHPVTGEPRCRVIMKGSCLGIEGKPVVVGANFDITSRWRSEGQRQQAQRFLQESLDNETALRQRTEAFIQRLIDVIPEPVFIKRAGGEYAMINEAFAKYRNVDKLSFRRFAPSKDPVARQRSLDEDQRVLDGEDITKEDHTFRQSTGEEVFRIISKRRSVFVDGAPVIVGVEHHITEWRIAERELKRLAEEDMLTGIANRRHFNVEALRAIERAHRYHEALSLVILDIDHFKHINDNYGHNVGDEVLREMAQRMRDGFRKSDLPGRWGGEEFVALLPQTMLDMANDVAERVRAELAAEPFVTTSGEIPVTVSGGSAQLREGDTLESLVARADSALYRAKHGGRNRIECGQADTA